GRARQAGNRFVDRLAGGELHHVGWKLGQRASVAAIRGANLDTLEAVEYVELGECKRVDAVDAHAVPCGHRIVPPAPPRPAGDGAVLVAAFTQPLPCLAEQLRWKRAFAHPCRVRLDNTHDAAHGARPDAESGADTAHRGVG